MMLSEQKLDPFSLPPGTLVGPWKVKAYVGGGAYGLVFRAVRAGAEQAGEVALKVACYPGDERFQREVVLLSRVGYPSVPRLLGHGQWQAPGGQAHPYIVMTWVEGLELYEWALPPGTDDYRSPEAWEYALQRPRDASTSYVAQPVDDVFALGVCAYRLVTE